MLCGRRAAFLFAVLALFVAPEAGAQVFGGYYPADTLRATDEVRRVYVPGPDAFGKAQRPATAEFRVVFVTDMPEAARAAFLHAANIWSTHLSSPVPILVEAAWEPAGDTDVLGSAGPNNVIANFGNRALADTWYASALANALDGSDFDEGADIFASFNSDFANWYFGTDGNTPDRQYDFVTVVLHELGHGLGFVGSFGIEDGATSASDCPLSALPGEGCWGLSSGEDNPLFPFVFDRFTEDSRETSLLNESVYPNPSERLGDTLQSGRVFFDAAAASTVNRDVPVSLYSPRSFDLGSSFSHLDEQTFPSGTPNALMTPRFARGEAIHSPGPVTCAILQDMGWDLGPDCLALLEFDFEPVAGSYEILRYGPNPFRDRADITFAVRESQQVRVEVYDVLGRQMATLFDGRMIGTGTSGVARTIPVPDYGWPAGVYLVRITGERFAATLSLVHTR